MVELYFTLIILLERERERERERESIMNIFKLKGIKFHGCSYGLKSSQQSHRSPLQYMVVVATCNIGSRWSLVV